MFLAGFGAIELGSLLRAVSRCFSPVRDTRRRETGDGTAGACPEVTNPDRGGLASLPLGTCQRHRAPRGAPRGGAAGPAPAPAPGGGSRHSAASEAARRLRLGAGAGAAGEPGRQEASCGGREGRGGGCRLSRKQRRPAAERRGLPRWEVAFESLRACRRRLGAVRRAAWKRYPARRSPTRCGMPTSAPGSSSGECPPEGEGSGGGAAPGCPPAGRAPPRRCLAPLVSPGRPGDAELQLRAVRLALHRGSREGPGAPAAGGGMGGSG